MFYLTDINQAILITKLTFVIQPFSVFANALAKTSIAILLQRLMGPGALVKKGLLWATTGIFWVLCIVTSIVAFAQCSPPSALWDLTNPTAMEQCWPSNVTESINLLQGSWGAFQDFFLAFFPLLIIWNLQLSLEKKISICALLGLGVLYVSLSTS